MSDQDIVIGYFDQLAADFASPNSDPENGDLTHDEILRLLTWVGNWADLCTAPKPSKVFHPGDGVYSTIDNQFTGDAGETMYPDGGFGDGGDPGDNRPADLPMPGLTIDHFFGDALAFTGQRLDSVGDLYQLLGADYLNLEHNLNNVPEDQTGVPVDQRRPQERAEEFESALERVFADWTGPAQAACQEYASHLVGYLDREHDIVGDFMNCLMTYSGIIRAARKNIVRHMLTFVENMQKKEAIDAQQEAQARQFKIAIFSAVIGACISGGFGTAAAIAADSSALPALAQTFLNTTNTIGTNVINQGHIQPAGMDYSDIAKTYLDGVREILNDARQAIAELVNGSAQVDLSMTGVAKALSGNPPVKAPLTDDHGKAVANG